AWVEGLSVMGGEFDRCGRIGLNARRGNSSVAGWSGIGYGGLEVVDSGIALRASICCVDHVMYGVECCHLSHAACACFAPLPTPSRHLTPRDCHWLCCTRAPRRSCVPRWAVGGWPVIGAPQIG